MEKRGRLGKEDVRPELGASKGILGAFVELSTERQIGMSLGPIPLSSIRSYLRDFNLPDWWSVVITNVDSHLLNSMNSHKEAS